MPVARYFLFVGGVLLALLLAIDAFFPQQAAVAGKAAPSVDKTVVRIRSDQKLPERVVYDTSLPTIVPPKAVTAAVAPAACPAAPRPKPPPRPACGRPSPSSSRPRQRSPSRRFSASARSPRAVRPSQCSRQQPNAGRAAVAVRLLRRPELEQHLVRCRRLIYRGSFGILSANPL